MGPARDRPGVRAIVVEIARTLAREPPLDLAAQLAYYGILALFPFAIFLVTIVGFLPLHGLEEEIFALLHLLMPEEAVQLFESTVRALVLTRHGGLLVLALGGALLAASSGVMALMSALRRTYREPERRSWLRRRLTAIAITSVAAVLVVAVTSALLIGPDLVRDVAEFMGMARVHGLVWRWLRWPTTMLAMSSLLAFLYWSCPPVRQPLPQIAPGAVVGTLLWVTVSLAFGRYVSRLGHYNKTYGALGAGIVLLVWIYFSGLIVLVGGTVNAAIWNARRPRTEEHLVPPAPKG